MQIDKKMEIKKITEIPNCQNKIKLIDITTPGPVDAPCAHSQSYAAVENQDKTTHQIIVRM